MDHFWDVPCRLLLWAQREDKAWREGENIFLPCTPLSRRGGLGRLPFFESFCWGAWVGWGHRQHGSASTAPPVGSSVTPLLMQKAGTESGAWGLLASALGHGQNLDRFPHPILWLGWTPVPSLRQGARTPPFQIRFSTFPKGATLMGLVDTETLRASPWSGSGWGERQWRGEKPITTTGDLDGQISWFLSPA